MCISGPTPRPRPRMPLAPTYNSSNPCLGSSLAPGEPSSAEKPLREAVRPDKGKGKGHVDGTGPASGVKRARSETVTDARAAGTGTAPAPATKRERLRSESTSVADDPIPHAQGRSTVPPRSHAPRRRDLRRYLEETGDTPRQPVFTMQPPTSGNGVDGQSGDGSGSGDEGDGVDQDEEMDESQDEGDSMATYDDDKVDTEQAMRNDQREHEQGILAEEQSDGAFVRALEPERARWYGQQDLAGGSDRERKSPAVEVEFSPPAPRSNDSEAGLTPDELLEKQWRDRLEPITTMYDLTVLPKAETHEPNWQPPTLPSGAASEDLYDEAIVDTDWAHTLDVVEDIRKVNDGIKGWEREYRIVDRLGEGTFSSVYKAIDIKHEQYDNRNWARTADLAGYKPADATSVPRAGRSKVFVAIKRIYVTSSPERIANEIEIMEDLRGCDQVIQLISAHRHEDQVFAVMPYHNNDDYRLFYRHLDPMQMRAYFRCMFQALANTHERGVIHRDVKPANFLFDYRTGNGVLVDFGLAERYEVPTKIQCQHSPSTPRKPHGARTKTSVTDKVEAAYYEAAKRATLPEGRVGFVAQDTRPTIKANRAGTRGFRAPEVLLKCPDQTYAIDVWAAGIILLSVLTHKFPVFNSNDDIEALMEIGTICGMKTLTRCAILHNRTLICNVPPLREGRGQPLETLVQRLNPRVYTPPDEKCSKEDARAHIESIDLALDLLQKLLIADHTKRWTAEQALQHPFLKTTE